MTSWILLVAGAYCLGSISFSYLLVRLRLGIDVRTVGSGNPGATNVARTGGRKLGLIALLLDVAKGASAVALARAFAAPGPVIGAAACAVVLGHVYPVFFGFRGGKGVATSFGALAGLAPIPALITAGLFVIVVISTGFVSLASVLGALLFPLVVIFCDYCDWTPTTPPWLLWSSGLLALIILLRHADNLKRLGKGQEPRLYERI